MENKIDKLIGTDLFDKKTYKRETNLFELGINDNILNDLITKKDNDNIKDVKYAKYSWSDPWMITEFSILHQSRWVNLKYQKFTNGRYNYSLNFN